MGKIMKALANPVLLKWARETAGLTTKEVSHKLKLKEFKIKDAELGHDQLTMGQLRRLANLYKRPIACFYLSKKPIDFQPMKDFRRIDIERESFPQLNFEIRLASYRREIALNLMKELDDPVVKFGLHSKLTDNPEEVALKIRETLRISFEQQQKWSDNYGYEALNRWRVALEKIGVLVFQSSGINIETMRGFSISEFPLPVIGINSKDMPRGRIFSLLHELVHIMLRKSSVCDINEEYMRSAEKQKIENFCNRVAGATLVPKVELIREYRQISKDKFIENIDTHLSELSKKFGASKEAILIRFVTLGLVNISFYHKKRKQFLKEYKEIEEKNKTRPAIVTIPTKILSNVGLSFARLVITSYHQEKINSSNLSDYFGMKLKHLPKMENTVLSKSVIYGA